jgi:hypothetical protein
LNQLISSTRTAYEFLARVEKRVDRAKVAFVEATIPPQRQPAEILGYTQLSTKHRQVKISIVFD